MRTWAAMSWLLVLGCSSGSDPAPATDSGPVFTFDTSGSSDLVGKLSKDGGSEDAGPPATPDVPAAPEDAADVAPIDTAAPDTAAPPDTGPPPDLGCVPSCLKKQCGSDGCGGTCGTCGEKEQCVSFTCSVDPSLGCEGLDLAEDWTGEFKGTITFAALSLIPFEAKSSGEMTFQIKCFNSKLIVSGKMAGNASDNQFTLDLSGTYDPKTKTLTGALKNGNVLVWGVLEYTFEGDMTGTLGADGTFTGTWKVASTDIKFLGQPNPTILPLTGDGNWSAAPGP